MQFLDQEIVLETTGFSITMAVAFLPKRLVCRNKFNKQGSIMIPGMTGYVRIQGKEMILKEFLCYYSRCNSEDG